MRKAKFKSNFRLMILYLVAFVFVCFSGGDATLLKYSLWKTFYCCRCLQEQIEQSQIKQSHISLENFSLW